jgi:hypothetical protein
MNQVFEQLFDRLEKLGYQVSHTDSYSHTIVRDGQSFDIKLLAMENKGIMHVMIDRELRSIEFDIEELLKDDGSSKMNGLLARITKIFERYVIQLDDSAQPFNLFSHKKSTHSLELVKRI